MNLEYDGYEAGKKWAAEMISEGWDVDIFQGAADILDCAFGLFFESGNHPQDWRFLDGGFTTFRKGFEKGALEVKFSVESGAE